jgi:5-methylthioadenosine/S-adenosylhomocysteine deaminase
LDTVDLLLVARYIATVEPDAVLERHALAIHHGRIVAVLPEAEARARFAAAEVVVRPRHLVTPGLVCTHVRGASRLFRGLDADRPRAVRAARLAALEQHWLSAEFVRDGACLAFAELLGAGVTCVGDGSPFPEAVAASAVEAGIRASVGLTVAERATPWAAGPDEYFDRGLRLHDEYRDHPLVTTAFAAEAVEDLSDATLGRLKVLVDQLEAPLVVALHQTPEAVAACRGRHGLTPLARLDRLGLANGSLVAVHLVHVGRDDVALAGRTRLRVVHCPAADLALGSGIAPVGALRDAGAEVSLGADATVDLDLLREARLAGLLAAGVGGDAARLAARDLLRMATLSGAAALGLDADTGSLAPGRWADLACFDLSRLPATGVDDPVVALVHAGGCDFTTDVWVGGRLAWRDGLPTRLDPTDLATRAAAWRDRRLAGGTPAARQ